MSERNANLWRPCANDNCPRPASPGEPLCETCALERSLYRRAERSARADARDPISPRTGRARSVESQAN
jgi:hypothetical protein